MNRSLSNALGAKDISKLREGVIPAVLFAALTGIGAAIRIPLAPVPVTMQVFFVCLSGLVLGPVWGPVSQLLYLLAGLSGAPFFAAPPYAGPQVLLGPTGGYLWGFVVASGLTGGISRMIRSKKGNEAVGSFLACMGGIAVIYLLGAGWLASWLGMHGKDVTLVYSLGVKPFVLVDILKALSASLAFTSFSLINLKRRSGER